MLSRVNDFAALIERDAEGAEFSALRSAELTGRPLGNAAFIAGLERVLGRPVARRAPGRKPRRAVDGTVGQLL